MSPTGGARPIAAHPAAHALWAATAPAAPPTPALSESLSADALVVGAGYTGLCAALHLAEAGASVCVLDAHAPGWGASGRNGGQVNPTLRQDPDELLRRYGAERAEALVATVSRSADLVYGLIQRHAIACDPVRAGWLQLGYTPQAVDALHARARQWERRGVRVELLDRAAVAARTGTPAFAGGWLDGRAGSVQPLAYVRGLVRAAQALGVQVHGGSPVVHLERQGRRWTARTAQGARVQAQQLLLATNGYTDGLWPGLARTLLAANSFIVATQPLGAAGADILARGETVSTAQRLLLYWRKDAQGRLLLGGRGHFSDPSGAQDFAHLERALARMFPQLGAVPCAYRWAGRVALTRDCMPHLHQPAPGITAALGYNGRGIATATSLGQHAAALLAGGRTRDCPYPVTPVQPMALHGLQRWYIAAGVAWYGLLDRLGR
ncbi:FAD-binding oxidoreductase [Verminephrobacter aporrectodeae subsp. tuberculatae]|uniref:NAD(P)/FAD-dependent oxidoreductase n=2 Tax=Verminephrobacter aporrectodeae TaxID=1110389 RepID=UPI002238339C|nr:FAD-dependent oxidoreductase [Verminephrobacter aporrectodeae]MCW5257840.1 FAD-binding oxidoreductase [Verminephrobacter aporrectodeae subsp. tuberculatae]